MATQKEISGVPYRVSKAEDTASAMVADTLGLTDKVTDFNAGSIFRTLVEAFAIQLEELDSKVFFGLLRAIPAILYEAFDFPRRGAIAATGKVTFSRTDTSAAVVIPTGTVVTTASRTAPKRYETSADGSMPIGTSTVVVPIRSVDFGVSGNTGAKTISKILASLPTVDSVTNNFALVNGEDAETEEAREERFRVYVTNLARSQLKGVEAGALSVTIEDGNGNILEAVKYARAVEHEFILSRFELFIDNGGGTATQALIDTVEETIDGKLDAFGNRIAGYKAAGTVSAIRAVEPKSVDLEAAITIEPGFIFEEVEPRVIQAVSDFIVSLGPFVSMQYIDLVATIASVDGVEEADLISPETTVVATRGERLIPGTMILTEVL